MNQTMNRVLPVFSIAFAVIYVCALELNWALLTYHPQTGRWGWLVEAPRNGPAMYWYGWLATAGLGAMATSVAALVLPREAADRVLSWAAWLIPLAAIVFVSYLLRGYFLR